MKNNRENFLSLPFTERKTYLITLSKDFFIKNNRGMSLKDIEKYGARMDDIVYLFKNLTELHKLCNIAPTRRKTKMSDSELKQYIENCVTVIPKGCWVTDKLTFDKESRRTKIRYKNKTMSLYRLVFLLYKGPLKKGIFVLHNCNNEKCFNPEHLRKGNAKDNAQDRLRNQANKNKPRRQPKFKKHSLRDPYDYLELLKLIKTRIIISDKNEWLYQGATSSSGYAKLTISRKTYALHRLILANKLNMRYEDITLACHKFPETSEFSNLAPKRHDINPDHLYNGNSSQNGIDALSYNKSCKLTAEQVSFIHSKVAEADLSSESVFALDLKIANILNVSSELIRNVRCSYRYKNSLPANANKKISKKPVIMLTKTGSFVKRFNSIVEAASTLGYAVQNVSLACNGKLKLYHGYKWLFETDYNQTNSQEVT